MEKLEVYAVRVFDPGRYTFYKTLSMASTPEDLQGLLNFYCKPDKWKEATKEELIEQFITVAATNHKEGKLNSNTATMTKLMDTLNSPKTSNSVKLDYARVLDMKVSAKDVGKLKFKGEDFKGERR